MNESTQGSQPQARRAALVIAPRLRATSRTRRSARDALLPSRMHASLRDARLNHVNCEGLCLLKKHMCDIVWNLLLSSSLVVCVL